jgi:hypothetical protein
MYVYHAEEGKLVVDQVDNGWHLRQAYAKAGKPDPKILAETYEPASSMALARLEKAAGGPLSTASRPTLPAYVPKVQSSDGGRKVTRIYRESAPAVVGKK